MSWVSGLIVELEDNWDTSVTSLPRIVDGNRETNTKGKRKKYKNAVFVYDLGVDLNLIEPSRTYRDENYNVRLEINSSQSETKRDDILSECERIIAETGITGYDHRKINYRALGADTTKFKAQLMFELIKYNEEI